MEQMGVGDHKTIQHILQMYCCYCSSMMALALSSLISFRKGKRTGNQLHRKQVELNPIPNFDPYSKQYPTLWPIYSLMSILPKLNLLCFVTAIVSKLRPLSVHIPNGKWYSGLYPTAALDHRVTPYMTVLARDL
jgi:hypothetical protein